MRSEIITVTPEMALEWVTSKNPDNRRLRLKLVQEYAALIADGQWRTNHQGIAFDENGDLVDGQHRLHAIIEANVPVEMMVTFDTPRDTFDTMDRHARRTLGDALKMIPWKSEIYGVLAKLYLSGNNRAITKQDVDAILPVFESTVNDLYSFAPKRTAKLTMAPVRAAVVLCAMTTNRDWVFENYRNYTLMDFGSMGPNLQSLIRQYLQMNTGGLVTAIVVRAWLGFDPDRANNVKLFIRDSDTYVAEIQSAINSLLNPDIKRIGRKRARA